jgi:hypothetical protein
MKKFLKGCHSEPLRGAAISMIAALFLALSIAFSLAYKSEAATQFTVPGLADAAFSIPAFPGTKLVKPFDPAVTVSPPFSALTFILRTESGDLLDAAKVVEFYREFLLSKGWKEAEPPEPASSEPSLTLRSRFYNSGTGQNITGQFSLYVAAREGLITLYLSQWRNSYAGQNITDLLGGITKQLNEVEKDGYLKYYSNGELQRWEYFFEDENFIEGIFYAWITEDNPRSIVEAVIAAYTDELSAQKAKNSLSSNNVLIECRNNILVVIKSYPDKPSMAVKDAEGSIFNLILSGISSP